MRGSIFLGATALIGLVGAEALAPPEITAPPTPVVNKRADDVTAVTGCHQHGSDL